MIIYVNFTTGEASFVGPSSTPIQVGPTHSIIDGKTYLTVHLSLAEIKALKGPTYQQLQLPHPKEYA